MRNDRMRKIRFTLILILILFAAAAFGFLAISILRVEKDIPLVLPFRNEEFAYTGTSEIGLQSADPFSFGLCVGEDNTSEFDVSLHEDACGALFALSERSIPFAQDMYKKIYPASITKIMTAIVAYKHADMSQTVTINWRDLELESGSQVVGLKIGDRVSMKELMYGLLVHSGNDAAQAIARVVGGSDVAFVKMMNEEAAKLGMTGTHFVNASGLHDADHYTTVYDIYLMLQEAMKIDDFVDTIQIPVYEMNYHDQDGNAVSVTLDSTDRYLTKDANPPKDITVLGGKTGTTAAAGNCLAVAAQNAYGQTYISVVVREKDKNALYEDMNKLLSLTNL